MIKATVDIRDAEKMIKRADAAVSGHSLASFMMLRAEDILRKRADERFAMEGAVSGERRWHPLQPTTITRYRLPFGFLPGPINVRTGALMGWLTSAEGTRKATKFSASTSWPKPPPNRDELAKKLWTAQKGRKSPKTNPRPVVRMNPHDPKDIMDELHVWIEYYMRNNRPPTGSLTGVML